MEQILSFPYTGVLFNAMIVVVGSLIGLLCRKGFPQKLADAIMVGVGLCVAYVGISGAVSAGVHPQANPVMPVIAVALGVLIGTLLDIDKGLNRLGEHVERKLASKAGAAKGSIAEGFVSASLLFCVGSMTVVGGINAGVSGDNTVYFTKGVIDGVSAIALTVSLGVGVMLSSLFVLLLQGGLVALSTLIEPLLTQHMIAEVNVVGSLLILVIGLNLMGITKIKVANYLPAIVIALLLAMIM
ncbi:MAG: DUF554 domain-containing protein [Oscillospiraceae bacterium]|nr:DUF554 domain-containing protein [Oscillospiraceae bacterium]